MPTPDTSSPTPRARKVLIAGPCSAESLEQLRAIVAALARLDDLTLIRVGVWKPRTRPGAFEGLGEPALGWMQQLSDNYGVEFCCEVARPEHVELCLRYGIKHVWLGARTTTNPFMVEELCSALRGTGMAVMIKNPVCPDASLWLGALERLGASGIGSLAAIHRGFNMYNNRGYRNAPVWEVAMELRRERPDVPIYCDPSHMGGKRSLLFPLASAAMQLDYDGLMIEVHNNPDQALTDAAQQITPNELHILLDRLHGINPAGHTDATASLLPLREHIDTLDRELLQVLSQRMALSRRIADVKRQSTLPIYQPNRWASVVADRLEQARVLGLDTDFVKELLEKIHTESIRIQMERD